MQNTEIIIAIVALVFTATAIQFDLRTRKIPNALTLAAFVLGLLFHLITGGLSGLGYSAAGFAAGFLPLMVLWLIGGGGGGDVKMMGALGAWLGAPQTLIVFIGSAIVAIMIVVALMVWKSVAKTSASTDAGEIEVSTNKLEQAQRFVPYAVHVTITTWIWIALQFATALIGTGA